MTCDHEGCTETKSLVECFLPDTDMEDDADYCFCVKHCHENGFCWMCGGFFAGIESFDFRASGLCDNCESEREDDDDWEDELDEMGIDPEETWE